MFLGAFCGITLYMVTLSNIFIKINVCIINFIKRIINTFIKIFYIPIKIIIGLLKKVVLKPILSVFEKLRKILKKCLEKSSNRINLNKKAKK